MLSRRGFLRVAIGGAPLLAAACTAQPLRVRLNARPLAPPAPLAAAPGTGTPQLLALGGARDGRYHVPARALEMDAAPLVLFLHGARQGSRTVEQLVPHAERTGTVLLAPDSRGPTWGLVEGDEQADLDFIDRALAQVFATCRIDAARVAIAGFSDGASAALSWGLVNGALFSRVAAFSPGRVHLSAQPEGRPAVFISHGLHDPVFPVASCGRRIAATLRAAGYTVDYREFEGSHEAPPALVDAGLGGAITG